MNLKVFIKNIIRCQLNQGVCYGFWLTCFPWKISPFSFPMGCDVIFEHLVFLSRPSSSIHFHLRTARTSTHFELSISLSLSLSQTHMRTGKLVICMVVVVESKLYIVVLMAFGTKTLYLTKKKGYILWLVIIFFLPSIGPNPSFIPLKFINFRSGINNSPKLKDVFWILPYPFSKINLKVKTM